MFFPKATRDIGYIKDVYDVTDKEDPKYWEHYLCKNFDVLYGDYLSHKITEIIMSPKRNNLLSVTDKDNLSKIIVSQMLRLPSSMEYAKEKIYPRIAKETKEEMISILPEQLKHWKTKINSVELTPEMIKEASLNSAFDEKRFERFCSILKTKAWVIYYNKFGNKIPFVTSDNPILIEKLGSSESGIFKVGIADPLMCLFFPLSPSVAIALYPKAIFGSIDGKRIFLDDLKYIMTMNIKLIDQAYENAFIPNPFFDDLCRQR